MEHNFLELSLQAKVHEKDSCAFPSQDVLKLIQTVGCDLELEFRNMRIVIEREQLSEAIDFLMTLRMREDIATQTLHRRIQQLEHQLEFAQRKQIEPSY